MIKVYWTLWALLAASSIVITVTGNLTMLSATVIGFLCFALTFAGMICVLPLLTALHREEESAEAHGMQIEVVEHEDAAPAFADMKTV